MDTDKLKALALAVIERRPGWKSSERDFAKLANPATVLALIAEVERLRADAARLDFMITEECQIEHIARLGAAPYYRVRWPWEGKYHSTARYM